MKNIILYLIIATMNVLAEDISADAIAPLTTGISWLNGALFGAVLTIFIAIAGYTYIRGEQEKAKVMLVNIFIGGVIVLSSAAISAMF